MSRPDEACRLFFESSPSEPRKATFEGIPTEKISGEAAAIIPEKTPTFKFLAKFKKLEVGHYVVHWRVKLLENFSHFNGLRFSVGVSYDAESKDISGSFDASMPPEELRELDKNHPHDLELEKLVVIQPHEGEATVELSLSNFESERRFEHSGLQVNFVEIKLFTGINEGQTLEPPMRAPQREASEHIVKWAAKSKFETETETMETPRFWTVEPSGTRPYIPITRLAWSKDSSFLAALAVKTRSAHITVWDMGSITDILEQTDTSTLRPSYAMADVTQEIPMPGDIDNLSIGLAISPNGDYVAIYQEPKIGQWDDTKLPKCSFPIRLLKNPLVPNNDSITVEVEENGQPQLMQQKTIPHRIFDSFVGYGAFLTEKDKVDWKSHCVSTVLNNDAGAESSDENTNSSGISQSVNDTSPSTTVNTLFVACNGLYINVFRITSGEEWTHIRAIRLTDLVPTFNRRIMCKTMMETISSNTFMWLEGNGLCCTLWDLQKGSNVSYIFRTDNGKLGSCKFRGSCKMAISPDESIVALACDDILTTYYASSGIEISTRKYTGHNIEYVGFYGQSNQLFVIVRRPMSLKFGSRILDPFQLKSQIKVNRVPIPIIGKSVLAFFRDGPFKNKGLVCAADGNKIHCYVSSEPDAVRVTKSEGTLLDNTFVRHPRQNDKGTHQEPTREKSKEELEEGATKEVNQEAKEDDKQYELKIGHHEKKFSDGDGSKYWILSVEVVEVSQGSNKVVFSFVPEPWMRVSTADVGTPDELMSVYFLPKGTKFVVAGMQTLQIWNFPTDKINYFHLGFIWSRPRMTSDPEPNPYGKAYRSELVGEYYHCIPQPKVYLDETTGNIEADFELRKTAYPHHVIIPAARGSKTQSTFIYCARSIHLLASAYAYSQHEAKKISSDPSQETITFGAHADAIARFTLGHVNRLLSKKDYNTFPLICERQVTGEIAMKWNNDPINHPSFIAEPTAVRTLSFNEDKLDQHEQVVNVLILLLKRDDLRDLNRVFIEGLLKLDSGRWIPHADISLNPIMSAIENKDERLLKVLIDYCIKCAKTYHAAYLTSVEQCLALLSKDYPEIVANDFLDGNKYPVFVLRSQLPTVTPSSFFFMNTNGDFHQGSESRFLPKRNAQPTHKKRNYKIYVSPFQFKPIEPENSQKTQRNNWFPKRLQRESIFDHIAGKVHFNNPAIVAIMRFKWYKFVIKYWLVRFVLVLVFFILMMAITAKQISVSSVKEGEVRTQDEIAARYLPEWRPVFIAVIPFGLMLFG
ncbi:hypothetical protein BGZ65_011228, partial [Modicella reniformis]